MDLWCSVSGPDDDDVSKRFFLLPRLYHSQHSATHRQAVLEKTTQQTLVRGN